MEVGIALTAEFANSVDKALLPQPAAVAVIFFEKILTTCRQKQTSRNDISQRYILTIFHKYIYIYNNI